MRKLRRFSVFLSFSLLALGACKAQTPSANQLTVIRFDQGGKPQGGKIVYGPVGASSQPMAMSKLLTMVQSSCGEKPQIGRVFQFRGTNSVGVFFTVTDHPERDLPLAGLVIGAKAGSNQAEAAMVYAKASEFGAKVNPMLQQLASVWHPGGASPSTASTGRSTSTPASGAPLALHRVVLQDSTASVAIPAGWTVDPKSYGGGAIIHGPHNELAVLNNAVSALDPNGSGYRNTMQYNHGRPLPGQIIYPSNVDLVKALPEIVNLIRRSKGLGPVEVKIDHAEMVSPPPGSYFQGERCVRALGEYTTAEGRQTLYRVLCSFTPDQYGSYHFLDSFVASSDGSPSQVYALGEAIVGNFQVDEALVEQRASAEAAPHIAQLKQVDAAQRAAVQANTARIVGNIQQIGANATARMNAVEAANEQQHADWNATQVDHARNTQGVSNYLLDQSVIEVNDGYGTVGHGTVWNKTAEALVKSDPNHFSYVDVPDYWAGTDFRP